jgi:putative glutamine amidotransferase
MSDLYERRPGALRPLIGIPWRTTEEEQVGERRKLDYYFASVRRAGGEPREISLRQSQEAVEGGLREFAGFVLPGSPADVDPAAYGAARHSKTKNVDRNREQTDNAILKHAFASSKPVLGICFGCQSLNVYLKGTLLQDLGEDRPGSVEHGATDLRPQAAKGDLEHSARLVRGSRLAEIAGTTEARINSSHHQSIDRPGEGLEVTARAEDGVVEGVEWAGHGNWIVGVQWHPERMAGAPFSERLFLEFVQQAKVRSEQLVR